MAKIFIPPDIVINQLIKNDQFYLCIFTDISHKPKAAPHFYFFVPVKIKYNLLICMITSQVDKIRNFYISNKKASASLINIDKEDLSVIQKESVIDCNNTELLTKQQLIRRIDPKKSIKIVRYEKDIPNDLKERIINGIENSPLTNQYIKNILVKKS